MLHLYRLSRLDALRVNIVKVDSVCALYTIVLEAFLVEEMDMDCWRLESVCVGINPWPGVQVEDEESLQRTIFQIPNEHQHNLIVKQCKQVCDALLEQSTSAVLSTPFATATTNNDIQHQSESILVSTFGTYHIVKESKAGVTEDFDVTITWEINIDNNGLPSFAFLLNKFRSILIQNSCQLGLDPLSISTIIQPPEYVVRFQFNNDSGSNTVDIRLAHANVYFAPV